AQFKEEDEATFSRRCRGSDVFDVRDGVSAEQPAGASHPARQLGRSSHAFASQRGCVNGGRRRPSSYLLPGVDETPRSSELSSRGHAMIAMQLERTFGDTRPGVAVLHPFQPRKPRSRASTMAWARVHTPSLSNRFETWLRTVFSLIASR